VTESGVETARDQVVETKRRSLVKALSWRVFATVTTVTIVVIMTGEWKLGAQVGIADTIFKSLLYFVHERLWTRIRFGTRSGG
jgi:adenylylsulfate kinase